MVINIINIHQKILQNIEKEKEKLPNLELQLKTLQNINDTIEIDNVYNEIDRIKTNKTKLFYLSSSLDIIQQFNKLLKQPIVHYFINNRDTEHESNNNTKEKNILIEKYKKIIQKYKQYIPKDINLDLDHTNEIKIETKCKQCNSTQFDDNVCVQCGLHIESYEDQISSYCDIKRICVNSRYKYNRIIHFKECIQQYQGKENIDIPKNVIDDLNKAFIRNHLVDESDDTDKKYDKIIKYHIYLFLKQLKYSKYYDNINYLYHYFTKKPLDNISHLENKIIQDFEKFTKIYDKKIKESPNMERKKNTQYILYQLLHRHKHFCKASSFGIAKSLKRNAFNDNITKECFNQLQWNIVEII